MLTVLGVDPSLTCTALVVVRGSEVLARGCIESKPKNFSTQIHRYDFMRESLLCFIDEHMPDFAAVEGYSFGSRGQQHSIAEWGGLLRWTLWSADVPYREVPPATLKKFVTGAGNADKALVLREVFKRWGFNARDDNEADAFGLAMIISELNAAAGTLPDRMPKRLREAAKALGPEIRRAP